MVLSEINQNIESKTTESCEKTPSLFSCSEIEKSIGLRLTETMETKSQEEIAKDTAMRSSASSSTISLTRYSKEELRALSKSRIAQEVPACLFEPRLLQFKLMDAAAENKHCENTLKVFSERLKSMNIGSWDPNLAQWFSNYQRTLVNLPINNYPHMQNPFNMAMPMGPMPQMDYHRQHSAFLDKVIPPYDRNTNFFDTITTTTAMRPPPQTRPYYRQQPMNRKGNSCAMEYKSNVSGKSSSLGYFSDNDCNNNHNKSSSLDGSMNEDKEKLSQNATKKAESLEKLLTEDEQGETEPEWYSVPATINDVVELHGFEDEQLEHEEGKGEKKLHHQKGMEFGTTSLAYRKSGFNQNRYGRNQYQPLNNSNNHNNNNGGVQTGYNNQRFRNPLHYQKQQPQMPTPNWPNPIMNPFFEMWKQQTQMNTAAAAMSQMPYNNVQNFMNRTRQIPPNFQPITEIENAIRNSNYLSSLMGKNQPQMHNNNRRQSMPPVSQSVPNFFNNWQPQQHCEGGFNHLQMPTQEQLQQHTTEIMRNAVLRKAQQQQQQQQQYQEEQRYFR